MRGTAFRWALVFPLCALLLCSSGCTLGKPVGLDGPVVEPLDPDPLVVLSTSPFDGQILWVVDDPIVVEFSNPMNTTSVDWYISPDWGDFVLLWSQNDTVLTLDPVQGLLWGVTYVVGVFHAEDKMGNPLVPGPVPNPWSFYADMCPVHISYTSPSDGATDVPLDASIWLLFSVCMDPYTLDWSIEPFIELAPLWDDYYTDLTFVHESPFEDCTQYTIEVDAIDYGGRELGPGPVPNPWSFTTECTPSQLLTDTSTGEARPLPGDMFSTDVGEPILEVGPPSEDGEGTEDIDNARYETDGNEIADGPVLEAYSGSDFRDTSGQGLSGGNPTMLANDDALSCTGAPPARLWLAQISASSLCIILFLFVARWRAGSRA